MVTHVPASPRRSCTRYSAALSILLTTASVLSIAMCMQHNVHGQEKQPAAKQRDTQRSSSGNLPSGQSEQVFSGPQPTEKLVDFEVRFARGSVEGKSLNVMKDAGDKPVLILFWNQLSRPAFAVINRITQYALEEREEQLHTTLVILSNDLQADRFMGAVERFPAKLAVTTSADGKEGPGSYGLNRNVALTVLVGKDGKVTHNFALIQPSVQADTPKILTALATTLGKDPPKLEDLESGMRVADRNRTDVAPSRGDAKLLELFRAVINKSATDEEVESAAKKVEEYAESRPAIQTDIGRRTKRIVESELLENYGTEAAQAVIRRWAERFGKSKSSEKPANDSAKTSSSDRE